MPTLTWRTLLPTVFLKLVSRSHADSVVTDDTAGSAAPQRTVLEATGAAARHSQSSDKYAKFVDDGASSIISNQQAALSTQLQVLRSPFSEPGHQAARKDDFNHNQLEEQGRTLPIAKPVVDGLLPVASKHRRTASASSDISLVSTATASTNPGVYTGLTQSGHYDLTQDVILRGEFITASQSKVYHSLCATCNNSNVGFVQQQQGRTPNLIMPTCRR